MPGQRGPRDPIEPCPCARRRLPGEHETRHRSPALEEPLSQMAVAIDGEIHGNALFKPLRPDSEIHFVPKIYGGAQQYRASVTMKKEVAPQI